MLPNQQPSLVRYNHLHGYESFLENLWGVLNEEIAHKESHIIAANFSNIVHNTSSPDNCLAQLFIQTVLI
mgnify:CR=1 FL=1